MTPEFYAKQRRRLIKHIIFLRGKYSPEEYSDRVDAMRKEMALLRREYHGGEVFVWAPLSLDYGRRLRTPTIEASQPSARTPAARSLHWRKRY